jgi:hypothetical protein
LKTTNANPIVYSTRADSAAPGLFIPAVLSLKQTHCHV